VRTMPALFLLTALASCATAPPPVQRPGPIIPTPIAGPAASTRVAALISDLGADDFARREKASRELTAVGQDPSQQGEVVAALRAAATSQDSETRLRARETLRQIDRSDSLVPGTDRPDAPMSYRIRGTGSEFWVKFWHRLFADGSTELEVEINDGPRELFSGATPAELASRVNEAARKRGYPSDQFEMLEDGGMRLGTSTISGSQRGRDHLVPDWGIWVARASRSDGLTPPVVWGGWVVQARALAGKAFEAGIQLRDVILEIDGKKPSTLQELTNLLNQAREITVVRAEARRVVVTPK
jgi:hypothetical protein